MPKYTWEIKAGDVGYLTAKMMKTGMNIYFCKIVLISLTWMEKPHLGFYFGCVGPRSAKLLCSVVSYKLFGKFMHRTFSETNLS